MQPFYNALGAVPAAAAAVGGGGGGGLTSSPHANTAQADHEHHEQHREHDHDRAQQDFLSETDAQAAATLTAEQED